MGASRYGGRHIAQAEKMSLEDAEAQYARVVYNFPRNLEMIRAKREFEQMKRQEEFAAELRRGGFDETPLPYNDYPEWDLWATNHQKKLFRQPVFVLDGASQFGKTRFVKHKLGPEPKLHIVSCSTCTCPDLRGFLGPPAMDSLLCDEGTANMLQQNRDLFQGTDHAVTLGHSGTNKYTYKVNMWRVKIVITSNSWDEQLAQLAPKDRAWVEDNTVVLRLKAPTFRVPATG